MVSARIRDARSILTDVLKPEVARTRVPRTVDAAKYSERREEPLNVYKQLPRHRPQTDVSAVLAVIDAPVGIEEAT